MADDTCIKFFGWDMGKFLKYFIISVVLFALCGAYVIVLVLGKENFIEANNYLVFVLTIIASVLSIVSLILSYNNAKQAREMQKEIGEKLVEIRERIPGIFATTPEDWKDQNGS